MGEPKFPRKKYTTPLHPWKEERIKAERELIKKYGLKNHKEVWKAKTYLGRHRQQARELLAKMGTKDSQIKKESDQLLLHLTRIGILPTGSTLDDVLALEIESVLSRRLQTLVYLKGFSTTPNHSRQLINHGHIAIGDNKVTIPSYMVIKDEENEIRYTGVSPLNELSHPARPKADVIKSISTQVDEKKPEVSKELSKPSDELNVKDDKVIKKEDKESKEEKSDEKQKDKSKEDVVEKKEKSDEKPKNVTKDKSKEDVVEKKDEVKSTESDKTPSSKESNEEKGQGNTNSKEDPKKEVEKDNEVQGGN